MKSNSVSPARLAAFDILSRVADGAYASVLLASRDQELRSLDRSLCHELVMGVLRRQLWLDRLIQRFANRQIDDFDSSVLVALRLGLYQLRFLSRVPASAAVNESVNLVYRARVRSAAGLVNAVLRRAVREPAVDPASDLQDPVERLAVTTSHPQWLLERWIDQFGSEETAAFANANNEPAPTAFRVVTNRASESEVCERLQQAGAVLTKSGIAEGAWRVPNAGNLLAELAAAGQIYLQDEASQFVGYTLNARPGERILDLCAAPGSKTTQIANLISDDAFIVAGDLHQHRLHTVMASAQLQQLRSINCIALDGLHSLPFAENVFDRVLVDAPCSGTGTLRRNPEIRWRISMADIADLSRRQNQLLFNAAKMVKPGGRLIYSTCSVEREENENVVQGFLENFRTFTRAKIETASGLMASSGEVRTWPHRDGTDGFFVQAFEKRA